MAQMIFNDFMNMPDEKSKYHALGGRWGRDLLQGTRLGNTCILLNVYIGWAIKIEAVRTAEMVMLEGDYYDSRNEREMKGFIRRERGYCCEGVISSRGRLVCG